MQRIKAMRTSLLLFTISIIAVCASAQEFQPEFRTRVPGNQTLDIAWADFDNDSVPDILVLSKTINETYTFTIFKNEVTGFTETMTLVTGISPGSFYLGDINSDNRIDIVLSGTEASAPLTRAYHNVENFVFQEEVLAPVPARSIGFADLDLDGKPEMVLSGANATPFFHIYKKGASAWTVVNDSIVVNAASIQTFDFDNDTDQDIFISGTDAGGNPLSQIFFNERKFYFRKAEGDHPVSGLTSASDLDHDGKLDILIAGTGGLGAAKTAVLLNRQTQFAMKDTIPVLSGKSVFTGDFTSDGKCDINLFGISGAGEPVNFILHADQTYDTLRSAGLVAQAFGDFDRDGDLDLAQLLDGTTSDSLSILVNATATVNRAPGTPFNPIAAVIFNRVFLYWQKPGDDHTNTASLTYDVGLMAAGSDVLVPTFDLLNYKRLLVNHGNTGHANYLLMKASVVGFNYFIEAVDNAYHAGTGSGICTGGGGASGGPCLTSIAIGNIEACRNEHISLAAGNGALWFSFNRGFLKESASLELTVSSPDTIFSVAPGNGIDTCGVITVYTISVPDSLTKVIDLMRYVCTNAELQFTAEPGFDIEWSSSNRGQLGNDPVLSFSVTGPDTVKLKLSDGMGCNILRRTALMISSPALQLAASGYQIVRGESVQLVAGGTGTFLWTPSAGLDDPASPTPIAAPTVTTQYTVALTDSLGCRTTGRVLVIVETTAFVPNLFTPNEDGKNDELKVYGLSNASAFRFSIFNREGSLVYSSRNIAEVSSAGWDGTAHGVKQPAGIYYWKIEGQTGSGSKILLNGKSSGSIVLIR
jgi:gliding motility-associated-like protein